MRAVLSGVLVVGATVFIAFTAVVDNNLLVSTLSSWLLQAVTRDRTIRPTSIPSPSSVQAYHSKELLYHVGETLYFSPTETALANLTVYWPEPDGTDDERRQLAATVVRIRSQSPNAPRLDIRALLEEYLIADDVISREWLYTLFFAPSEDAGASDQFEIDRDTLEMLAVDLGTRQVIAHPAVRLPRSNRLHSQGISVVPLTTSSFIPSGIQGPVLITASGTQAELWPVYRLYSDTYRAFLYGMYPTSPFPWSKGSTYRALRAVDDHGCSLIPVLSRLYGGKGHTAASGKRIAVKDVYDVKGVVTSAGSRPYGEVWGEAKTTASSILRLEELGGHVVGKTKTAAFAVGSIGNPDTVDEQYPFSARGDGWQTCSGSSSGSACAMGAYDWLDFAIGTDTGGSIRHPAAIVGLYGGRPSTGMVRMDGVVPLSNFSDTAGAFGRDPRTFAAFLQAWYDESRLELKQYPELPKSLLVATEYAKQASPEAQSLVDAFIAGVQDNLDMVAHQLDLDRALAQIGYSWPRLQSLLKDTVKSNSLWTWTRNGQPLQERYSQDHGGRYAPIDPEIREEWDYAREHGNWTLYEDTVQRLRAFSEDFNGQILGADEMSCSKSILLYDIGSGGAPLYREAELNRPFDRNITFPASRLCPWAGCVDLTIPIGQVAYRSAISHIDEQKAVTVSLVAPRACDFMMLALVERLAAVGLIQSVQTGRTAFPVD